MKSHDELIFEAIGQLQTLSHIFIRKRAELAKQAGLTEAQWRLLDEIGQEAFMPSMFASQRENSKAAISKTLRQLTDAGLITVAIASGDARQRKYTLTPLAVKKLKQLQKLREAAIDTVWRPIDRKLLASAVEFNEQLIGRLKA